MKLAALPAFTDNYIWWISDGSQALVVDPGDAAPVMAALAEHGVRLAVILVTHHHPDHTGGIDALRSATGCAVLGPHGERLPEPVQRTGGGDRHELQGLPFEVIDVPGHTAGHIAWYCPSFDGAPLLFCGDTLFSAGCGRLFEGTPAQMLASLDRLAALPGDTRVCCTHEYTLANLRFAREVEPDNRTLADHQTQCETLRARGQATLPSRIALEREINPFLRVRQPQVRASARAHGAGGDDSMADDVAVFAALRAWKNNHR